MYQELLRLAKMYKNMSVDEAIKNDTNPLIRAKHVSSMFDVNGRSMCLNYKNTSETSKSNWELQSITLQVSTYDLINCRETLKVAPISPLPDNPPTSVYILRPINLVRKYRDGDGNIQTSTQLIKGDIAEVLNTRNNPNEVRMVLVGSDKDEQIFKFHTYHDKWLVELYGDTSVVYDYSELI